MHRRELLQRGVLAGGALAAARALGAEPRPAPERAPVVDAHCHAGKGLNYGRGGPPDDPWTTYNDPERIRRRAAEAGIDRSVIFPINNLTYQAANEEIAGYVRKHPRAFIGFAKHDPKTEAGRIRGLLTREVRELGLKGLKLHGVPSAEMLEAAAELGIPVLAHPPRVSDLVEAVRGYPRVPVILAHLGSFASRDWREHRRAIE